MRGQKLIPALAEKGRESLLLVSIAAILCISQTVAAQSGRHPNKSDASTQPTIKAEPASDSQPIKPTDRVSAIIVAGEIVHNYDYFRSNYLDAAYDEFKHRIKQLPLPAIEVTKGGSMSLNEAKERAKKETKAHLLWLEFVTQDDGLGNMSISFINYALMSPQTAKFLTWGKLYPGDESIRSVGKVLRVPNLPKQRSALHQMKDGAREVAERLIAGGWL